MHDSDLTDLLRRTAEGDQAALATFYDLTNRTIYPLILRILNDPGNAEEVLLDVFTQVWRQAASYDGQRGSPLAWLTTIARSRSIDRLRATRPDQRKESLDELNNMASAGSNPEEDSVSSERKKLVRQAMNLLSIEQREVIELAYFSGLSQTEIAAKLNQPLGTVKTRARLGMIKLRDALAPLFK